MNKKLFLPIIIVFIFFAGLIAVTQEFPLQGFPFTGETSDIGRSLKWYRSNQGGMALEEAPSSSVALGNEYALSISYAQKNDLPQELVSFYNDEYLIELRTLYENGTILYRQWFFKERNGRTRLSAEIPAASQLINAGQNNDNIKRRTGFIEIFNSDSNLITEYNFFNDGENVKVDYEYSENLLISAVVSIWDNGSYKENYGDFFRYNRSSFLRYIERFFFTDSVISLSDEAYRISFPRKIADAAKPDNLTGENLNPYPDFFGDVHVESASRIVYTTDERGRIITQTLYDDEDSILWVIKNTWQNDRIVTTVKIEDDSEFLAEFEYSSSGERIIERNYKNGILERVVRTEGKTEIEELYFNGMIILRAVWEDGRKISETRTGLR